MSTPSPSESVRSRKRWRFSIWDVLWLQLLIAPAFLAPIYAHRSAQHTYLGLFSLLLAPICYVGFVVAFGSRDGSDRAAPVLHIALRGALYGTLFGSLSMLPLIVWDSIPQLLRQLEMWRSANPISLSNQPATYLFYFIPRIAPFVLFPLFILFHYALIGAATGGLVGITRDLMIKNRHFPR